MFGKTIGAPFTPYLSASFYIAKAVLEEKVYSNCLSIPCFRSRLTETEMIRVGIFYCLIYWIAQTGKIIAFIFGPTVIWHNIILTMILSLVNLESIMQFKFYELST